MHATAGALTGAALAGARRIEEASLNAWPALQQVLLDGWVLRFAKGFTKRANSIVPLYPTAAESTEAPLPSDELLLAKIRYCENLYAREQLTTVFRLTSINQTLYEPGSPTDVACRLDALLSRRGYALAERNFVLACELGNITAPPTTADAPELRMVALDQWLSAYCRITGMDEPARTLHGYILRAIAGECGFALLTNGDGEPVACGLAVLERELVGLFDVVTQTTHRRQGHSRRLLEGIFHWAKERGAERAYLQVVRDNAPALALYRQLGFAHCYDYWYRIAP